MWKLWKKPDVANDVVEIQETSPGEIRTSERRRIYREAFLHLPEAVRVTAVAMDISPLGARLRLARSCHLPEFLEVTILDEVKREPAKVAWQSGIDIGLEFTNPNLDADTYFDSLSRIEFDD